MTWVSQELPAIIQQRLRRLIQEQLTSTKSTVPDELSSNTKGAGDTEENGVILHLIKSIVGEEDTRVGVNVGPGVLGLASLPRNMSEMNTIIAKQVNEPQGEYQEQGCKFGRRA